MRILIIHNSYQQRGGEDSVVEAEASMLSEAGHDVRLEIVSNDAIRSSGGRVAAFINAPNDRTRADWAEAIAREHRADIVHVHNFFPLLTPAVHEGASRSGAAVVQTLHNYRLLCANAMFLRDEKVCEKCLSGSKAWAVVHRCYRGSAAGSLALVRMQWRAERNNHWRRHVHRFIALTEFAASKFVEDGLPEELIVVKPNTAQDPGASSGTLDRQGALFVGRISSEKGLATAIEAWKTVSHIRLTVIGDGPERERLQGIAPEGVEFLGPQPPTVVQKHMRSAAFLVVPSVWYEGFPMTVVEAYSCGLPVVASRIGSLAEIVKEDETGCLFEAGNAEDLGLVVKSLSNSDLARMSDHARAAYDTMYSKVRNLHLLEAVYNQALGARDELDGRTMRATSSRIESATNLGARIR